MIWRPMDVLVNNQYGPMQEPLARLYAKTQDEIYGQEMLRKEEERSLIAKEKERQCKCEEENKLRRVREFLKKTKD